MALVRCIFLPLTQKQSNKLNESKWLLSKTYLCISSKGFSHGWKSDPEKYSVETGLYYYHILCSNEIY